MKTQSNINPLKPGCGLISDTLDRISRENLRQLAKAAGVPIGKNRAATEHNLRLAIGDGKLTVKATVEFNLPNTDPSRTRGELAFLTCLRSYKCKNHPKSFDPNQVF